MTIERCPEPVNFKELFRTIPGEEFPKKRTYKGKTIFLADKFPVQKGEKLKFTIESVNSRYPQGFAVGFEKGHLVIDGEPTEKKKRLFTFLLREDHEIEVFTKENHIFILNFWEETIYEEQKSGHFQKEDGTFSHSKIVKYPEGKPVICYVDTSRWRKGLCNGAAMYSELKMTILMILSLQ
jgi:hypothetical protein